ncbi:SDR family NAD(P)-dependent oxidoreductase [Chitinophaga sancti]|uniref:NAD(P)-dependent dehydrogenase, short-chain alcohol dehydrogenase family n=1 Tax=Chitinophaga sancti TaxID=1004 RepID=A0A1K1RQK0_9BACT|nr:SDR family NAD(P)-dependent oxidoreductase [Chitinophaga sancti]WQD62520.1 SDR family NAD(P)-dependent oxidoreductase [Chitinophaga sancti]WQG91911.1 SDR family NAD(P)-dependent oxidoreductase [Chitinophaga sancti]SFW74170.1 NAD(P)-dependent dehydrogenase, short-chain alcohol dehydrogenase family [Chitinophaga sancti]
MKHVLVTGANKGIGFEIAKQMAQLGYYVYLGCRDEQNGTAAINRLKSEGLSNIEFLQIDVADLASVQQAAAKVPSLDILINNAATSGPKMQNISACDIAALKSTFNTNYFGVIQTTQAFLPLLKKAPLPVIVNVSSELGSLAMQTSRDRAVHWDNYHAYSATKTALNTFTINLSQELRNFKINSVTPGFTATDLNNFTGPKTAAEGALPIVRLATIGEDGPSGQFFRQEGEVAW